MQIKRVDLEGSIIMYTFIGWIDKGGHYDVEMKGWMEKGAL